MSRSRLLLALVLLLGGWLLVCNACGGGPLIALPLQTVESPLLTDDKLALARRYAPIVYHAIHPSDGRQDIPTRVDFDGDMRGDNNWETMPRFRLIPTLYYAVLTTRTHHFISYHLFHPRDYSYLRIGLHLTHENDGENLQVVVDRKHGRVVLLFTQAHYFGRVYADPDGGFSAGREQIRGPLALHDASGRPDPQGSHVGVFVEWGGHGIYGLRDRASDARLAEDGSVSWHGAGMLLVPAAKGQVVKEPAPRHGVVAPYRLESTLLKLWPGLRSGQLLGEGGLFDGVVPYQDSRVALGVPRFYEANRFSGPLGPDRGISPFAVDFDFSAPTLGALFFDPARRYAEVLKTPQPWAREYVDYPY